MNNFEGESIYGMQLSCTHHQPQGRVSLIQVIN